MLYIIYITKDEFVDLDRLRNFTISGLGGSDMSAAMIKLAKYPEVEAAIVITDGGYLLLRPTHALFSECFGCFQDQVTIILNQNMAILSV